MSNHVKQSQTMSNHVKPCQTKSNYVKPCQTMANKVKPCQTMSNYVKPCQTMSNKVKPCQTMSNNFQTNKKRTEMRFFLDLGFAGYFFSSSGRTGIAPCCVQTKADTATAFSCASRIDLPRRSCATKVAVKLSPAPTVSATCTLGVAT